MDSIKSCQENFFNILNVIQTPTNKHRNNRLLGFINRISTEFNDLDKEEIKQLSYMAILQVAKNYSKIEDKSKIEAVVWTAIKHHILNYAKSQRHGTKNKIFREAMELDFEYGFSDDTYNNFEINKDFDTIFGQLKGYAWRLANLLYLLGPKQMGKICEIMGISNREYYNILGNIRTVFAANGY